MWQTGARFADNFYITTAVDPDNGDCFVTIEMVYEDEKMQIHGQVVWDEPDGDLGKNDDDNREKEAPAEDVPKEEVKEKE